MGAGLLGVALFVSASSAAQQPKERPPERRRLRLDESPDLVLLEPFRHASLPTRHARARWRASRWGAWVRANAFSFDWAVEGQPHNPNVGLGTSASWASHLVEPRPRWPLRAPREHWFEGGDTSWLTHPIEATPDVVPPWLSRTDVHWAHHVVAVLGCGRGGPCTIGESFPAGVFLSLFDVLSPLEPPPPWWECKERPLRLHRFGPEKESFLALDCDGSVPAGALETLSIMARPPGVARPEALPAVPENGAEWIAGIRVMHPRLLWVLHRVALAFPWKAVHLYSGYRPAKQPLKPGSHSSKHAFGRAVDIKVQDIDNEELLALCHKLVDVGCGYYPNGKFVHFDVRWGGSGLWVDASAPGEKSRYVNGWPGVVENGRVVWTKPDEP